MHDIVMRLFLIMNTSKSSGDHFHETCFIITKCICKGLFAIYFLTSIVLPPVFAIVSTYIAVSICITPKQYMQIIALSIVFRICLLQQIATKEANKQPILTNNNSIAIQ